MSRRLKLSACRRHFANGMQKTSLLKVARWGALYRIMGMTVLTSLQRRLPVLNVSSGTALSVLLAAVSSLPIQAQSFIPTQAPKTLDRPKSLALPPSTPTIRRQLTGTGFFVDDNGHLLTAAHVVEGCVRLVIEKEGRRVHAKLVTASARLDLALLKVPKTMGLAAVFPRSVSAQASDLMFAGGYDRLPGLKLGGGLIANSRVASFGEDGMLALDSPVTFGASGAPVLDHRGLVQGVISRRASASRVLAVGVPSVKAFLAAHGVQISEDDRPQIAGTASRAHRAASMSARVTCLQS